MSLNPRPCILKKEEGEEKAIRPTIEHLIERVGSKHKPTDANVRKHIHSSYQSQAVLDLILPQVFLSISSQVIVFNY
jgi:hypothetical protein